jgi:hypothetical protein
MNRHLLFTADALKAACPSEPTLGANICPSAGSVGVCETSTGPTALALDTATTENG